jgi:hypothetical protein
VDISKMLYVTDCVENNKKIKEQKWDPYSGQETISAYPFGPDEQS